MHIQNVSSSSFFLSSLCCIFFYPVCMSVRPDMNAAHFIMEMRVLSHRISRYLSPINPPTPPPPSPPPLPSPPSLRFTSCALQEMRSPSPFATYERFHHSSNCLWVRIAQFARMQTTHKAANKRGVNQTREETSQNVVVFLGELKCERGSVGEDSFQSVMAESPCSPSTRSCSSAPL